MVTATKISPKVLGPFVAGILFTVVHFVLTGEFDNVETEALILSFAYGAIGYSFKPGDVAVEVEDSDAGLPSLPK